MLTLMRNITDGLGLNGSNVVTEVLVTCLLVWMVLAPLPMRIQRIRRQILSLAVGITLFHLLVSPYYQGAADYITRWASCALIVLKRSMGSTPDMFANTVLSLLLLGAIATGPLRCSSIPAGNLLQRIGGQLGWPLAEAAPDPRAHIKIQVPNDKKVGGMTKDEIKRVFKEILEENDSPFDEDHLPKYGQTYFAKVNASPQLDWKDLREDVSCLSPLRRITMDDLPSFLTVPVI